MLNVISVDVEDYFHVEALASSISRPSWESLESRVERNVGRILELFGKYGTRGTFFILGWVAERFPSLVRRIADARHDIGSHGFAHQRIHRQTPEEFRSDVRRAQQSLMDEVQRPVIAYRAPSFSIVQNTKWALDILA
jgi:polysaccharide deacetylase family protein (PEP-CTERM system associated)